MKKLILLFFLYGITTTIVCSQDFQSLYKFEKIFNLPDFPTNDFINYNINQGAIADDSIIFIWLHDRNKPDTSYAIRINYVAGNTFIQAFPNDEWHDRNVLGCKPVVCGDIEKPSVFFNGKRMELHYEQNKYHIIKRAEMEPVFYNYAYKSNGKYMLGYVGDYFHEAPSQNVKLAVFDNNFYEINKKYPDYDCAKSTSLLQSMIQANEGLITLAKRCHYEILLYNYNLEITDTLVSEQDSNVKQTWISGIKMPGDFLWVKYKNVDKDQKYIEYYDIWIQNKKTKKWENKFRKMLPPNIDKTDTTTKFTTENYPILIQPNYDIFTNNKYIRFMLFAPDINPFGYTWKEFSEKRKQFSEKNDLGIKLWVYERQF